MSAFWQPWKRQGEPGAEGDVGATATDTLGPEPTEAPVEGEEGGAEASSTGLLEATTLAAAPATQTIASHLNAVVTEGATHSLSLSVPAVLSSAAVVAPLSTPAPVVAALTTATAEPAFSSSIPAAVVSTAAAVSSSEAVFGIATAPASSPAESAFEIASSSSFASPTVVPEVVIPTSSAHRGRPKKIKTTRPNPLLQTTGLFLAAATANALSMTSTLLSIPTPTHLISTGTSSSATSSSSDDDDDSPTPTPKASPFLVPHAVLSILAFFVIFPLGMAIARRYRIAHIAFQVTGAILGLIGVFMGKLGWTGTSWRDGKIQIVISAKYDLSTRLHKGLGWGILTLVILQSGVLGALKMMLVRWQQTGWSIHIRWYKSLKKIVNEMHKANAWVILGAAYIESAVGVTSLSGTCLWDGVGGCLGHIIAGSALVWYSAFFLLRLLHPQPSQNADGRSEEFWACIFITITGVAALISSIIAHDPPFSHSLLFVAGGVLGLTVEASKVFRGRNPVPGLIILTLGFAAAFSTNVDPFSAAENDYAAVILLYVGYCLAAGGLFRIVEVAVRKPAAVYASVAEEEDDFENASMLETGSALGGSSTNVLGNSASTVVASDEPDSDLDEDAANPGFTADMDPATSAMANIGTGANGKKPNSRPGSIKSTSNLVSPRASKTRRRNKPVPVVRWETVPAFLSLFFIFLAGTLFIGSSSGAPPRWAWLADVDSIGYAEIYVAAAMICMAWVVLVGAIAQRMRNQMSEKMMERQEEDSDDEEEIQYQGLGAHDDDDGVVDLQAYGGGGTSSKRAMDDIQMREFLGEDE